MYSVDLPCIYFSWNATRDKFQYRNTKIDIEFINGSSDLILDITKESKIKWVNCSLPFPLSLSNTHTHTLPPSLLTYLSPSHSFLTSFPPSLPLLTSFPLSFFLPPTLNAFKLSPNYMYMSLRWGFLSILNSIIKMFLVSRHLCSSQEEWWVSGSISWLVLVNCFTYKNK